MALQGLSFYEATTLVVEHKPEVLVGVDEHLIYSTIHADGAEPLLRMAVESLLVILVDTIAYTGMNPEVSLPVLLDVIHGVVGNGLLIQVLIKEVPEAKTVKAVETRLGGKPHISLLSWRMQLTCPLLSPSRLVRVLNSKFNCCERLP